MKEYSSPVVRAPDGSAHSEQRQRKKRLMAHHGLSGRQWVRLRKAAGRWPVTMAWMGSGMPIADILRTLRARDRKLKATGIADGMIRQNSP